MKRFYKDVSVDEVADGWQVSLDGRAIRTQGSKQPQIVRQGETSLEGLVREMLRPMLGKLKAGLQYLLTRTGPLSMSLNHGGGFVHLGDPGGAPDRVKAMLEHELQLIGKLEYEPYFLTVRDIVAFARSQDILCQGRGSAANSVVCYALGITEANLTLTDTAGPTVLLGAGDDFETDETMGLVRFIAGGTAGLAGAETITVVLAADAGAPATIERVNSLKAAQLRYAVKALVENANNLDEMVEMEFHSVALIGDGDLSVVGDELAQMTLTGVAESNTDLVGAPTLTISKAKA